MLQNQYLKVRLGLIDLRENKTQGDDALKFRYFVEICLVHIGAQKKKEHPICSQLQMKD